MVNFIKKRWYVLFFLLGIFILFIWQDKNTKSNKLKEDLYQVKKENIKEVLTLSGEIDAEEKVVLKFQTSGRLAWVGVKEGDYVKKYQSIAALDQRDLKNRLDKYLNTYAKQRNSFEQTKDDYWNLQYDLSETIRNKTKRILENNQYDLNNAVLDVEYQNLVLENANLSTPIEGIVTRVDIPFAGINITPAQAEFEIVNPKTIYFSATADQTEIVTIKEGQKGKIIFDSFPDKEFEGEIYWIAFTPKSGETGTIYPIKIKFNPANYSFKLGMSGEIEFLVKEKRDVLTIPQGYIKKDNKGEYVNLIDKSKVKKVYIKKGEEIDGRVIIQKGLKEGDIITN
ncbi:MAG: efflux RND transporter periplasmic adaptor subunit [Microgenomates group bacterium]